MDCVVAEAEPQRAGVLSAAFLAIRPAWVSLKPSPARVQFSALDSFLPSSLQGPPSPKPCATNRPSMPYFPEREVA